MITITDLVKKHDTQLVLDGVCLQVPRGEAHVLLGPSGGGKSTLLRCINGLEPFQQGRIQVDDIHLSAGDSEKSQRDSFNRLRRRVGMVFQQFNLFPHMDVLRNVTVGPRVVLQQSADQAEPFARQLLERVGLGDRLTARPDQLSGGQQQRVAIARALAMKPEVVLFDEPTSALDPRMAAEVLSVITDLARHGQTMIIVTHAMNFAKSVGTTIHVMHAGRIAESGPPQQIFEAPTQEVTREFLNEARSH